MAGTKAGGLKAAATNREKYGKECTPRCLCRWKGIALTSKLMS